MVAPLIAAAGRALLSNAAKSAAKSAVKSAGKNAVKSSLSSAQKKALNLERSNARRRFNRAAERYEKIASSTSGTTAERYETLASRARTQAQSLKANLDVQKQIDLINESRETLQSRRSDEFQRGEMEAGEILRSPIGSRIFAGTKEIWENAPEETRLRALRDHFGVKSNMELIEKIEQITDGKIYADPENSYKYDEVKLMIQAELRKGYE